MFNIPKLIAAIGYFGIGGIIFAESGLFFGFFLPGDSLLFTAGFLASQNLLNIWALLILTFVCAVLGDQVGYWFGRKAGPKIFTKEESIFFHKDHITRTQDYFAIHGKKTIILARFIPIIRTFAPIMAGVGNMEYSTFLSYNIIGGFGWTFGLTLAGYFLGSVIPDVDKYLLPIITVIIILSVLPAIKHFIVDGRRTKEK
ncbi:MAG: VTT domain-containing protein [Candidatus Paceibacterota bacterium]|jgi:membrane-associated protein